MKHFNIPHFNEQRLVLRALVLASKNSSKSIDKYVQWMITGAGAGLVYLIGKAGEAGKEDQASEKAQLLVMIFIAAAVVAAMQRFCAMVINVSATTFQESEKLPPDGQQIDLARFFIIYIDTLPPSFRWAGGFVAKQFLTGKITTNGKWLFRISLLQGALATVTTGILLFGLLIYLPS